MRLLRQRLLHAENVIHHQLVAHSVAVLRVAVGAVFLGFGVLKYFPGVSPAENLTNATTHLMSLGLVPGGVSIVAIATLECFIGVCLLAGRWMRLAIWLLALEFVGILAPLALLPGRLFAGPHGAPTLEGQYVLKDVILVAAGMVIAAATFRGGRLVRDDLPPGPHAATGAPLDGEQKLRLLLESAGDRDLSASLCDRLGISEAEMHDWRATAREAAARALEGSRPRSPVSQE
jgi:putative oxidoreductase